MRRALLAAVAALASVVFLAPAAQAAARSPYVVVLKPGAGAPEQTVERLRASLGLELEFRYRHALQGFSADLTRFQAAALRADSAVAVVTRDQRFQAAGTRVPLVAGESVPVGVRRIGAATTTQTASASTVGVAVLDTGVDLKSADLNVVSGTNCVKPGTPAQDDNGHGTHVAGTIAARNAGAGVTGVAPGTRIHAVKVLDSRSSGTLSQILCGINWVTANAATLNIRVANMSLGGSGADDGACGNKARDAYHQAICASVAAGVTYVAAAGNNSRDLAKTIPAAYPEVLAVTAMTDTDGVAGGRGPKPCTSGQTDDRFGTYSNFAVSAAAIAHTIAAPGTCVTSTKLGGGTAVYQGTSQAAPHVAGAAALCHGSGGQGGPCAGLAPSAVIARLRSDAATSAGFYGDPRQPVNGKAFGSLVASSY